MAGKTIKMSKLKQILQWKLNGCSNRRIAEAVGLNKGTVNLYVNRAKADPLGLEGLLRLDEPELDRRLCSGHPAYTDERFETFKRLLPYFVQQMSMPHMTLLQLWMEYKAEHPDGYELTQFRYHYRQNTVASKTPGTILADMHSPGEKIYIDFSGDKLSYVDRETGEIIHPQTFVACLPSSNYAYAVCVPSRARHPKDKSSVEGMVKIAYNRIYAPLRNRTFFSLSELNEAVGEQMRLNNQRRMSLHPYSREERFLATEKPLQKPLPEKDFEVRYRTRLKVQDNGCVLLGRDKHYYTVPYTYIGQQVDVDYTRSLVKIYAEGSCIATHERDCRPGQYSIINGHLASQCHAWRSRSREYYVNRAMPLMEELATLINYMFVTGNQPEEVYYNGCDGLLHLCRTTDPVIFREACETALQMERYSYRFVKNVVAQRTAGLQVQPIPKAPAPIHENIRGAEAFK